MSKPAIIPDTTTAGIAVDPRTLERVIPESRRPDGSVRKQIKIRPGFTPQEDVRRFRGTRQAELDARALPKGHIIGWAPPPAAAAAPKGPLSKGQKKALKAKEKKKAEQEEKIRENWDDDDDEPAQANSKSKDVEKAEGTAQVAAEAVRATGKEGNTAAQQDLSEELAKLKVS